MAVFFIQENVIEYKYQQIYSRKLRTKLFTDLKKIAIIK